MKVVMLGLSITSSWGNGHAATFRGLARGLSERGHHVTFLERNRPWYARHRDLPRPPYCAVMLYEDLGGLERFTDVVASADLVMVGSYVPDGAAVADWVLSTATGVTSFYDLDTPVTLTILGGGACGYVAPAQIRAFDYYFSFTGGEVLKRLEQEYGAQRVRPLYCAADTAVYRPEPQPYSWDLGYLGTYRAERQAGLERLLLNAARRNGGRFVVAGSQYPDHVPWPGNVERIPHLTSAEHRGFYTRQRFTLHVGRAAAGRSVAPSAGLFEAAACGTPIISDWWEGIDRFFVPGEEILIAHTPEEVLDYLSLEESARQAIGAAGRARVLREHSATCRAEMLEQCVSALAAAERV